MRSRFLLSATIVATTLGAPIISIAGTIDDTAAARHAGAPSIVKPIPKPYAIAAATPDRTVTGTAMPAPRPAVPTTVRQTADPAPGPDAAPGRDVAPGRDAASVRETIAADAPTAPDATLQGADVVSIQGDTIGEIDAVVMRDGTRLVQIGVGGFLGFGETAVLVPVSELERIDAWTFRIRMSPEELQQRYAAEPPARI